MNIYKLIENAVKPIWKQIVNAYWFIFSSGIIGNDVTYDLKLSEVLDMAYCIACELEEREDEEKS